MVEEDLIDIHNVLYHEAHQHGTHRQGMMIMDGLPHGVEAKGIWTRIEVISIGGWTYNNDVRNDFQWSVDETEAKYLLRNEVDD